ncbi:effector-binding domain-containing protein [Methanohalophilus levihalophilus]|uniref:GyrI-like domain-containing protein n=1 Tax=Methanohalophilus levihalophilus TaxID=1431282 RepID=UPI001AE6FCBA|nr:GyrI-like domain-containing protein [Methanohalophilus levihalophilus]MBP2031182.1 effector-binding domain-containing protein [Methanohalophilus levihalophilus]
MADIIIVDMEPQMVISLRRIGPYQQISDMIPELYEFAEENGVVIVGAPIFICHEISVEEAMDAEEKGNADVEVVFPVDGDVKTSGEVKYYELAGGKMAKTVHKGPYEAMVPTYEKLYAWLEENRKQIIGPMWEIYLSDPREVPPEDYVTEIYVPVD